MCMCVAVEVCLSCQESMEVCESSSQKMGGTVESCCEEPEQLSTEHATHSAAEGQGWEGFELGLLD